MATPPDFTTGQVLTAAQMNAVGMWLITSDTLSGTSKNFESVFNDADYENYFIVGNSLTLSGTGAILFRMLNGSTPASGNAYGWAMRGLTVATAGADVTSGAANISSGFTGFEQTGLNNAVAGGFEMVLYAPHKAARTFGTVNSAMYNSAFLHHTGMVIHDALTAYNGIQFLTGSAVTMGGRISIYGYNK